MKYFKYLFLITLMTLSSGACKKIQQLPDEPHVEFRNFTVFDTTDLLGNSCKAGRLNFYFEDGDGDLGLDPAEFSTSDDTVNLFLTLFRKNEGELIQVTDSTDLLLPYPYTIPYLESHSQNKILKGTITVTILYLFYMPEDNDTIRYDFYIKDRAAHLSNTESTCEIALSFNDLYKFPEI